jgi:LytR cell envelope-related transcriptional attenuator
MNQRVPDSGGLPLRAMVMVLLFLAVVFLLLGINAVMSGGNSGSQATPAVTTTTTTTSPAPARAAVHVYNISEVEGAAARTGDQLTQAGWTVTVEPGSLELPDVTATTVFYTDAPGERKSAEEVAKLLNNAPVEQRRPELADLPPGVIVTVTG